MGRKEARHVIRQKVFIARKSPSSPPPLLVSPRCPQLARVLSRRPLIATALPGEGEINKTINQVCQEGNQSNNQSIKALPGRREINQSKDKSSKQSIKRVISDGWSGLYWIGDLNLTINQYESLPARRAAVGTVRVAPVAVVKTCTLCFYWLSLCFYWS